MGWMRTILLGDIGNRLDIEDSEREIERLKSAVRSLEGSGSPRADHIEALRAENAELKLYLAATLRLLMEKGVFSREDIDRMVNSLDWEDGMADGKFRGPLA